MNLTDKLRRKFIPGRIWTAKKSDRPEHAGKKIERTEGDGFVWFDLQNPERRDIEELASRYSFNELNIEDCMTKFELPKFDSYGDHFFAILHFPPLVAKDRMQNSQLSMFVGRNFLVTIHQGDLKPLVDLVNACKDNTDAERKDRLLGKSPGVLLHEIVDILVDDLLHTTRRIIANLDDIEDEVFDDSRSAAKSISILRREINIVRRIVNPLKRFVLEIAEGVKGMSESEELELYFDDVIDHINKIIESLEESRETMEIYKDTDFMLSTEKTNKVLAALTIIFTLAIPATVIGTFYGMNVHLPGGIDSGQAIWDQYQTFAVIMLASIVPAVLMIVYFRKLGWIGR